MKLFGPKFKPNRYVEKNDESGISRRDFLKRSARGTALGALAVADIFSVKSAIGAFKKLYEFYSKEDEDLDEQSEDFQDEDLDEQTQELIEEEDVKSIREIIDYNQEGRIEFNLDSVDKIRNYWKKRYSELPLLRDFRSAYKKMGAWEDYLEKIFEQEGVPKEYIYLAIPESHWRIQSKSPKGAAGPYQFVRETADSYGLEISDQMDDRLDPLLAGSACANLLKDLEKKGGDWETALSGYNGGFIWGFLDEAYAGKRKRNYESYLEYIEDRINKIRDEIKNSPDLKHKVRRGDTLGKIARRYGTTVEQLAKDNGINDSSSIARGMKIIVPDTPENREKVFWKKISGYSENLNYPAKFQAVIELIKKGVVGEQDPKVEFELYKVEKGKLHTVKSGEWAIKIAEDHGISLKSLQASNPRVNLNRIGVGQTLNIPGKASSLNDIAELLGKDLKRLRFLNPGIIDPRASIRPGYNVKV